MAPLAVASALLVPTLLLIHDGLGLPSALAWTPTPLVVVLLVGPLLPALLPAAGARRPLLGVTLAGALIAGGVAFAAPAATPDHPRRVTLIYHHDRAAGRAEWLAIALGDRPGFLDEGR